ncbi:MAG: hypothetical protein V7K69_24680 [Nostoc sp.]|uniref:hypothetical protein n=1 Tax=Nostoc sp. TaxID=1180 RepID=UPI002FF770C6
MAELSYMQEFDSDTCGGLRLRISIYPRTLWGLVFSHLPLAKSQLIVLSFQHSRNRTLKTK